MATLFGTIGEFDPSVEDWTSYSERMDFYYLQANEVENPSKRRSILLTSVGPRTYKLLRNLVAPSSTAETPYKELVQLLSAHYKPAPTIAVERLRFHSSVCRNSESVSSYVAHLRELSEFCEFSENLEDMLRD